MLSGFCEVEEVVEAPGKLQFHKVGAPVEVEVKLTQAPKQIKVSGTEMVATGV